MLEDARNSLVNPMRVLKVTMLEQTLVAGWFSGAWFALMLKVWRALGTSSWVTMSFWVSFRTAG